MENLEKLRILLQHWIDHNKGHADEFGKWQETMAADGHQAVAGYLHDAVHALEHIDDLLAKAMEAAGGKVEHGGGHHHHGHHHDHHHH